MGLEVGLAGWGLPEAFSLHAGMAWPGLRSDLGLGEIDGHVPSDSRDPNQPTGLKCVVEQAHPHSCTHT